MKKTSITQLDVKVDYKQLFNNVPDRYAVILPNDPDFTFVEVSEALLKMTGCKRSDIIGKNLLDAFPDISETYMQTGVSDLKDSLRRVLTTGKPDTLEVFRCDIHDTTGQLTEHYWRPTHYPIFDKTGRNVLYILQSSKDITNLIATESKLNILEDQFEQALSVGLIGVWSWDIIKNRVVTDRNLARLFNIREQDAEKGIPMSFYTDAIHSEDRDRVLGVINRALEHGGRHEVEFRTLTKSNTMHWVMVRGKVEMDKSGNPIKFIGVSVDITELKQTQAELDRTQHLANIMSDSLPIMLFTANPEGIVTYFNKHWQDYTGDRCKKMNKHIWEKTLHPSDVKRTEELWQQSIKTHRPFQTELRIKRHDGVYRWHLCHANPIKDTQGNTYIWFGSITDINDLRETSLRRERLEHITKALKQQRKELVVLNRSKDEFISVASHQLRTPATAVKQYLGMLLEGYLGKMTKSQISALETAYHSNERQLETVNDLLRVAQADAGKIVLQKERMYIRDLLQDIIHEQQEKFKKKNQTISLTPPPQLTSVYIDKARMLMVFDNLLDNANKYTPEGKNIEIVCKATPKTIEITVKDEGIGIAPEHIHKLFEKFSRIDNPLSTAEGGTGLGLYWAQKIVALHNGTLKVESDLGKGTSFIITLPLENVN